jgi:hypothetical protein
MESEDPLLSISQVARLYGTGLETVIDLVRNRLLPSLDDGRLIEEGRLDVPIIRKSWATSLQSPSEGADRIIHPEAGQEVHPAARVALDFHAALDERDSGTVYELSTPASQERFDPKGLLDRWFEINEGGYPTDSGVGSAIYSLAPLPAVAARVFAQAPKVPRIVEAPTPASLIAVLPLQLEGDNWRVDLQLYEGPVFLPRVLAEPMPSSDDIESDGPHSNESSSG